MNGRPIPDRFPGDKQLAARTRRARSRQGGVLILLAFLLPVLALLAAFCINAAHMQLSRTELMVATDAAARAGGRTLSETQSVQDAKTAARETARMNRVSGVPLQLNMADAAGEIEFGTTTQPDGPNGRYRFQKHPTALVESGQVLASAVRVNGRRVQGSLSGPVPMLIPGLLDMKEFEPVQESVAMQVDRDISLILDRSGSMEEVTFHWPPGLTPWNPAVVRHAESAGVLTQHHGRYYFAPGHNTTTYQQWAWQDHHGLGPPPRAPWQDLVLAVDKFLNVLERTPQQEQVSIASYSTDARLDSWLEKDYGHVRQVTGNLRTGGWTAIGDGMEEGIEALLDQAGRPFAAKTMVVMTDGNHNRGKNPVAVANGFVHRYNLTIHTVTFGEDADKSLMRQVARIGSGRHYHAATGQELIQVFEEIANNLPTILTH